MPDPRKIPARDAERHLMIASASGAHAVFLAAQHDPSLKGAFTISHRQKLFHNGELVDTTMLAQFLVYLTGKYGIRPKLSELEAGFKASAAQNPRSVIRKKKRTGHVSPRLLHQVDSFIRLTRGDITTQRAAKKIMPDEYKENPRSVEMRIAQAFRTLGYKKTRCMVNCMRRYRWRPDPDAPKTGLSQTEKDEFENPTTTSDDYSNVKTQPQ
tara:strand:+ start:225 stop:860 length:636 start_codon:yes stop_codon:yes gene_type:complete